MSSTAVQPSTEPPRGKRRVAPAVPAPAEAGGADLASASFAALLHKLDYLDANDIELVRQAFRFADEAHLGQFRATGEPYITHPIAVAGLCADWKLDAQAIMAALMHDAMEDCGVTKTQLIERFGAPTAELVDGLTKLDKLQFSTKEESQAESFRKMLLAMARDVRVILVKLADRLHNMRTLDGVAPAKRRRIARETMDIYAPIAHRLGLDQTYRELQDLCFRNLMPWREAALAKAVTRARGYRRDTVERIRTEVEAAFERHKLAVQVSGREKTLYSIYHKMRDKHLSFAEVNDIFGFRIIVASLTDCYIALGILHQLYKPVLARFKDYIAIPKANGYQSLHTTLVGPVGTPVEFQIRTEPMHAVAEAGIAAHWMYKASDGSNSPTQGAVWLQSLIDIQDETRDSAEFLEHVKVDLFPETVYVFTPRSRILSLPRGATVVDFAYAIHSDVGQHCVAAKVNGEQVPLRTELKNGDVVEVITAPVSRPNPAWLNFVRTGRARSKIRHYLKNMEAEESRDLGEKMLAQAMRAEGLQLPSGDETSDTPDGQLWAGLVRWTGNKARRDLLIDIGLGKKIATIVAKRLAVMMAESGVRPDAVTMTLGRYGTDDATPAQGMVMIDGTEGASVQLAHCCRPIPGDAIVGYLGRGEGLVVHTADCHIAKRLFDRDSERWIPVGWSEELQQPFEAGVAVVVENGKGVLAKVASAFGEAEADITHLDMGHEPVQATTELRFLVRVRDRVHLAAVLRALKRTRFVLRAGRIKPN